MKNLNKLLMSLAVTASLAAVVTPARAVDLTDTFDVSVTLSSICEVTSAVTDVAFTYTSFQTLPATSTGGNFSVRCTSGQTYTLALDATSGTVSGLNYTLSVPSGNQTGTGVAVAHQVTGGMVGSQAGSTTPSTDTRTLTITY